MHGRSVGRSTLNAEAWPLELMALADRVSARIAGLANESEISRVLREESERSAFWDVEANWVCDPCGGAGPDAIHSTPPDRSREGPAIVEPLTKQGRVAGVVIARSPHLDDECVRGVERLAREISLVLDLADERARRLRADREAEIAGSSAELSRMLIGQAEIEDASHLVLQDAKRLTGSPHGFVGYIDPQTGYLIRPTLTRDIWDECKVEAKSIVLREFTGLRGYVLKERKPVLCNAPASDPRSIGVPRGHIPIQRFLSAPALLRGRLLGQVAVANSGRDYTEEDLGVVERLACVYAIAVERSHAEAEMIRIERLKALEDLAGAVSHNLNNVLTGVLGHTQLLQRKIGDPSLRGDVDRVLKASEKARDLVSRLTAALVGQEEEPSPVALNMVVRDALEGLRDRLDRCEREGAGPVKVETRLRDVPAVRGTRSGLDSIVTNLVLNSLEAMPRGGTLTISTRAVDEGVILTVADTGRGMESEVLKRAFEPLFSSSARVGAGLGLSLVRSLASRWGGSIEIRSAVGEGTEVAVRLPLWNESPTAPVASEEVPR